MQAAGYKENGLGIAGWLPVPRDAFNRAAMPETPQFAPEKDYVAPPAMEATLDSPMTAKMTRDEIILAQRSGLVRARGDMVSSLLDDDEEESDKKKENDFRAMVRASAVGGEFKFTVSNVIESLSSKAGIDRAMLHINNSQPPITNKDMLRLDEQGNQVKPENDPDGKYIVRTIRQKRDYETKIRACTSLRAQEEVSQDENGNLVLKETIDEGMRLQSRIEETELTIQKLKTGEMTPDDLEPHMRADILARHNGDTPQPDAKNLLQTDAGITPVAGIDMDAGAAPQLSIQQLLQRPALGFGS